MRACGVCQHWRSLGNALFFSNNSWQGQATIRHPKQLMTLVSGQTLMQRFPLLYACLALDVCLIGQIKSYDWTRQPGQSHASRGAFCQDHATCILWGVTFQGQPSA